MFPLTDIERAWLFEPSQHAYDDQLDAKVEHCHSNNHGGPGSFFASDDELDLEDEVGA